MRCHSLLSWQPYTQRNNQVSVAVVYVEVGREKVQVWRMPYLSSTVRLLVFDCSKDKYSDSLFLSTVLIKRGEPTCTDLQVAGTQR